jgi:hypothetical protein
MRLTVTRIRLNVFYYIELFKCKCLNKHFTATIVESDGTIINEVCLICFKEWDVCRRDRAGGICGCTNSGCRKRDTK